MKPRTFLLLFGTILSCCQAQLETTVEEVGEEEEHVELFPTPANKMAAATSDFGYNLYRAVASRDPNANIFLAPISVSAVLTQLSMGASERAERQLYRALRYHTLRDPQLHNTLRDLLTTARTAGKGLSAAARLYLSRRFRVKPEFFTSVEQQYNIRPKTLTAPGTSMKEINDWVSQETGGKVQRILSKALPRNPGVSAVSAAFFKGTWVTRFGQSSTTENFQLDAEKSVRVPMMQQDNYPIKMGIDSDLSCTIAQIQMQDDVSMFIFLPDDASANMTLLEESLTAEFVQDLSRTLLPSQVSLKLPVLKPSYSTDLLPVLGDLGLSEWLAEPALEKISAQSVKLTTVNHKVVMEMAPEGKQYPSATSVPSNLSYHVDRPFLYLIRDEASGALLIIGKVVNPKTLTA